jgi:multidrug efflux system membrane fusion protein
MKKAFPFNKKALALLAALTLAAGWHIYSRQAEKPAERPTARIMPVRAAEARIGDMDIFIRALGTVTSPSTVTIRSRVDGQLMALHFTEGQVVRQGDLLAEIDPRPYEVRLQQALGNLARNEALLKAAELDLDRYRRLIREQSISEQQLQSQEGLVGQFRGSAIADKAAVADAELQLSYSRITAPISGRVGLRNVDVGNMIRAGDSEGIVVITQIRPMYVIFTLVERQIPEVIAAMRGGIRGSGRADGPPLTPLMVEAWGQDNRTLLATGELLTIDNQIDTATGTVRAKAAFTNDDRRLFPNQFVNVRLKVRTLEQVLIIPSSAVQRNNDGFFVYVVRDGKTRSQAITTDYATDMETVVDSGLAEGDVVVTDGVDRLRDGMPVTYN